MTKSKLPKSVRKFIRKEKARIRREVFDIEEQERLLRELYQKFINIDPKNENKRNLQPSNSKRN